MSEKRLRRDYIRFTANYGVSPERAQELHLKYGRINQGLDAHFGPGKSPFKVLEIIVDACTAHILADNINFSISKWRGKLMGKFGYGLVVFYDLGNDEHAIEWEKMSCNLDKFLSISLL